MTKSRPSATRLRLSRLFRWLAVLCFIKLAILGMLMLDVPLPVWLGGVPNDTRGWILKNHAGNRA